MCGVSSSSPSTASQLSCMRGSHAAEPTPSARRPSRRPRDVTPRAARVGPAGGGSPVLGLRGAPVAPRAGDVLAHDRLRPGAVAGLDRGEELRVLGDVVLLPVRLRPRAGRRSRRPTSAIQSESIEPEERVVPVAFATARWNARARVVRRRRGARCALVVDRAPQERRDRSSLRRSAARRARTARGDRRASSRSSTRPRPRSATKKPRFTSNSTRPSPASRRRASRTEPREMPSASASSAWPTRAPGARRPSTIIARNSSYASPTTERTRSGPGLVCGHRIRADEG